MTPDLIEQLDPSGDAFDLTPLIDVVFILLTFFLVATTLQIDEESININLPKSASGSPIEMKKEILVVTLGPGGKLFVGEKETTHAALVRRIRSERANEVIIRGDTTVQYGAVVKLIDVCNQAGVDNINLNTIPKMKNEQ
jgi:biopolymer transport protein ExbD